MKLLYFFLFFFAFSVTFSNSVKHDIHIVSPEDDIKTQLKEAMTAVFGAGKFVMNAIDHTKRQDGGRDITGAIEVFEKQNVVLFGSYSKAKRIENLSIELPEGTTIDFKLLDELVDGKLKAYLPSEFPLEAGVWVKNLAVKFGASGYAPTNMTATVAAAKKWELLGIGSFAMNDVEFSLAVNNPKLPSREITGEVSALASFGEIPVSVTAMLSNNSSKAGIKMSIEKVNLKNVIEATLPNEAVSFLEATPQAFKDLELTKASINIIPSEKELKFTAQSSVGGIILDLKRKAGVQKTLLAIRPPASFKFSSLSSNIAALDDLDMSGSYFIVSDKQTAIPIKFLDEASTSTASFNVKKGFNLMSSMKLPQEMAEMLKVTDITLSGSISPTFTSISLFAELGLDLSIGENKEVSFDNIGAGLVLNAAGTIELRLEGAGSFKAGEERVSIYGGIIGAASPSGMSLEFEAGLAADGKRAERPESCIVPQAEWKEPFGIPGVGIRSLGLGAGIGTTFPFINVVSLGGNIRLGTVKDSRKHICGSIAAKINIADVAKTMLVAEVQNMTPLAFIEAFSDAKIEGDLRDALNTGIESAKVKIVPKEVELFGQTYYPGLALDSAKLKFLGMNALIGFSVGESGISAYGSMDRFAIEEGGMKLFAIESSRPDVNGKIGGPMISLGLNATNPHFKLDGSVTILGITNESFIKIDKTGFEFETTGKIAGGALTATAHIKGGEITPTSGLYAKVAFENKLQTMVADELLKFIETESKKSQEAYKDAKKVLAESKGKNDFEQAFVDLASETVDAFAEMDRGMAVAGSYVVEGLLKEALNVRKLSFEGEVTSMKAKVNLEVDMTIAGKTLKETVKVDLNISEDMFTDLIVDAIGEDVIDFFGSLDNEIANGFEKLGAELETAFEDLGGYIVEGAEVVGEAMVEGAEAAAEGIVEAGEYMAKAFEDLGKELEKVFVGDTYTAPVSNGRKATTPYNHSHFTVTIKQITTTDDEGIGSDGLELYGSVLIKVSSNIKSNKGSTPFAYGKSMVNRSDDTEEGQSVNVYHTKDFYVANSSIDAGQGWIQMVSKVMEWNSNVDYDHLKGSKSINIRDLRLGVPINGSFKGFEDRGDDEEVKITYTVKLVERKGPPPPPPSDEQMRAAARYAKISELDYLMKKGGNIKADNIVEEAIKAKVPPYVVEWLYKHGNMARASQLVLATQSQYRNPEMIKLLLRTGVRANPEALYNEIGTGNINDAKLLVKHHAEPQLRHIKKAISRNDIPMINYLLSISFVQVGEAELNYAVSKNNVSLAKKFIKHGAVANSVMITNAIKKGNAAMVDELLKVGKADHLSLLAAAERNDTKLFKTLTKNRVRVINVDPIHKAIDKNNMEILKDGITHGGSKDEALAYAITKSKKPAMIVALEAGAHGTGAIDYAVNKVDVVFFDNLINKYHADVNVGLNKAYLKNNIKMGTIALNSNAKASNHIAAASKEGKIEWVKLLLSKKADPNLGLKGAVENKHTQIVKLLLDAGAKVKDPTLIGKAATNKNLPMVKMLIEQGGAKAENGRLAAINNNDIPMVTYLLSKGAKPIGLDIPAGKGWMPMVRLLVENKANPDDGMASALQYNKGEVLIYLLDNGAAVKNYIKEAAGKSSEKVIRKFIEKGANPTDGVFLAVKRNRLQIVKVLIDAKADVSGGLVMHEAVNNWDKTMIELLLAHDGNTGYLTPRKSFTFLHRAADKKGKHEIVKLFIDAGADVDARNKFDETPLHLAVRKRGKENIQTVQLLIDAKANVNAFTRKNKSVLQRSRKVYKQMLIDAGAL